MFLWTHLYKMRQCTFRCKWVFNELLDFEVLNNFLCWKIESRVILHIYCPYFGLHTLWGFAAPPLPKSPWVNIKFHSSVNLKRFTGVLLVAASKSWHYFPSYIAYSLFIYFSYSLRDKSLPRLFRLGLFISYSSMNLERRVAVLRVPWTRDDTLSNSKSNNSLNTHLRREILISPIYANKNIKFELKP